MHASEPRRVAARGCATPPPCHVCGGHRLRLRFPARLAGRERAAQTFRCTSEGHRHHADIWACDDCGLLFQWPRPADGELLDAYGAVEDPLYEAERENRYYTFRRLLPALGPGDGRRLLDVGAYCGYFLDVARDGGFRAEGLELSRWASERASGLGFVVHRETLAQRAGSTDQYDVLTLWDVIEHLSDPRAELEAAFRLVRPGGVIHVSTIDAGSRVARALGARWPWLMEMHLFYFTRATLTKLLEEAGFDVVASRAYVHVVSVDYLLRKIAASFPPVSGVVTGARKLVPARWRVPVNLGDNMWLTAVRRA